MPSSARTSARGYNQNVCNQGTNKRSGGLQDGAQKQIEGMQKGHHEHEDEILSSTSMHNTLSSANGQRECDTIQ